MKTDRSLELGEKPIAGLLLKYSIPAIAGMIIQALYNIADRYFIGIGLGDKSAEGIAAITVGFPYMLIAMAFGMLVGIGGNAAFSIYLGQKRREMAEKTLGNSLVLLVIISAVLGLVGIVFLDPLLVLFGATPELMPYARDYLSVVAAGSLFNAISFGMNNFIRSDGAPQVAMMTMLMGAVINIILDPIFIMVFGWGVKGAAIATVLSMAVSSIWVLAYFFGKKAHVRFSWPNLRLNKEIILRIVTIGVAPFLMQIAASLVNAILNNQLKAYGELIAPGYGSLAISAMGIIFSVSMIFLFPLFGLNMGSQPLIGYNYGAQKYQRVRRVMTLTTIAATSVTLVGFILIQIFPQVTFQLFNSPPALVDMGTTAARIFFLMFPFLGFQIMATNYFQSVGKPKHAMLLSLSRQVLFLIPLLYILPLIFQSYGINGLMGVWVAVPVADLLASAVTFIFYRREMAHLGQRDADQESPTGPESPLEAVNFQDPNLNKGEIL